MNYQQQRYVCPDCGTASVQLCYPVWLNANEPEETPEPMERVDWEAEPEKDSDRGYCPECNTTKLLARETQEALPYET